MRRLCFSTFALLVCAFLAAPTVTGCYAEEGAYVRADPPPDRVEVMTASPGEDHVWVRGRWQWNGAEYVWVSGHWMRRPHARAVWNAGRWRRVRHGWVWVEGHWD